MSKDRIIQAFCLNYFLQGSGIVQMEHFLLGKLFLRLEQSFLDFIAEVAAISRGKNFALHYITLHLTALCITLNCTKIHCLALHYTVLNSTALTYILVTAVQCNKLYSISLH